MLTDFPSGAFREQAVQHMFEIANYWLDDTRKEMEEYKELREGKRWIVWPEFAHFAKTKPLLDEEGRALEKLEQVRYNDMTGPQAEKDYEVADFYRRTGHPCSAYFCYEIVRRRYPGTTYFDRAAHRMEELRVKLEKPATETSATAGPEKPQSNSLPAAPSPNLLPGPSGPTAPPGQLPPGIINPR